MQIKDELADILDRLGAKIESETESQAIVVQETNKTLPVPQRRSEWGVVCKYPIDLCRISPFSPVNRRFAGKKQYIHNVLVAKTAWGEITYSGLALTTYEEDVLIALIAVMESSREETEHEGKKAYRYHGPMLPILKALGYKSFGKEAYRHIFDSLRVLSTATMELKVKKSFLISPLVYGLQWGGETKEISVALNPYFYEVFQLKFYSLIEIEKRMSIGSPIGKALYRFMVSQRDGWKGFYMILAKALNLDIQRPKYRIREDIRNAVRLLISRKILSKRSCLDDETVTLILLKRSLLSQEKPQPLSLG